MCREDDPLPFGTAPAVAAILCRSCRENLTGAIPGSQDRQVDGAHVLVEKVTRKLLKGVGELHTYVERNQSFIPNYGERSRRADTVLADSLPPFRGVEGWLSLRHRFRLGRLRCIVLDGRLQRKEDDG
jgi:hypothetical protein